MYTLLRIWRYAHFHFLLQSRFEWEPLELHKQMIPHFLALDVRVIIFQAQLCTSIRGCHATFLVKNTLFKGEVEWQPLKEMQICSSSILDPPTRAFKWCIVCLSTHTIYKSFIIWRKCGGITDNGIKLQWLISTKGNWKNRNPGSRFGATS